MTSWKSCSLEENLRKWNSGITIEIFVKIKVGNQKVMCCWGLCQHGIFASYYIGNRKNVWRVKKNTIWAP